ncbi:MAG TPA: fibronectin type III domain-containing protein [Chitinophagaceae bacterium]|nr:fibronectin type III domain-containing protein [Chitinophagaceae bacterium]
MTTNSAMSISPTSVASGGVIINAGGSVVTDVGIVWDVSPNPTILINKHSASPAESSFTSILTGLTPGMTYHLRAYATNAAGTGYGSDVTITTQSAASSSTVAQVKELEEQKKVIDGFIANQKTSIFKFGISVAVRSALNTGKEKQARAIATITPSQNFVSIDYTDLMAVVVSTTVAAYPFRIKRSVEGKLPDSISKSVKFWTNFGFLGNVNLVEFANSNTSTVFNKQVDGGLGFSYLLGVREQFAVAITYERISVRQPTKFVFDNEGKQIIGDNNTTLTTLDIKDPRYFRDAGMNGISIKFIFHFN